MAGTRDTKQERQTQMNIQRQLNDSVDPVEKIRLQCLQRGVHGIQAFARTFKIMDDDADHKLTLAEFTKGLHDYAVNLEASDVEKVFAAFDRDNSGTIHFDEFLIALRPQLSKSRVALIETAFKKLDKSGDGVITIADLKGVYNVRHHPMYQNGEKSEAEIFKMFLDNFDTPADQDGKINYEEFLNYYTCVSSSIDTDVYFDLMMRNAWKL